MANFLLIFFYIVFAVSGSTLIKYGGITKLATLFTVPVVNVSISVITLLGIACYGLSFLMQIVLLNKFSLSFITPITTGLIYVFLMITAVIIFSEHFTPLKIIGCTLILAGVMLVIATK